MRRFLLSLCVFALGVAVAWAQPTITAPPNVGTGRVQQVPTRLDATQFVAVGTNYGTVAQTAVATAVSGGGLYVYITGVEIKVCGDGVANGAVMTNTNFVSTGLQSTGGASTPVWQWSQPVTAYNTCNVLSDGPFAVPIKSAQSGTNVTITSPAMPTHTAADIKIYYYLAP